MTTEKTLDQMLDLLPYVSNVLSDPDLQELGRKMRKGPNGEPAELDSLAAMQAVYPVMITRHRADLYGIIGVQLGIAADEVKDMPFEEVRDVLNNDSMRAFFDFFPFLLQMAIRT